MTVKSYPVKIYYFYDGIHQPYHKPIYFGDKYEVQGRASQHAQTTKTDVTVWVIELPRTLNAEVAMDLINGRFDKYPRKRFSTERYYKPYQEPPKAEAPKAKADAGIPKDPYLVLGIPTSEGLTKETVQAQWKLKAREHHEAAGGNQQWMSAVNAARDKIFKFHGWK